MLLFAIIINVLAWMAIGYVLGNRFTKYAECGSLCAIMAGVFGALAGGFVSFLAYGLPNVMLWPNNLLFAMVGALGSVYISLPEVERARKVEQIVRSFKRLNQLYVGLAGLK